VTTSDAPFPIPAVSGSSVGNPEKDERSRNRILLGLIALLLALLLLFVAEVSGAFGYRIINGIAQLTGNSGIAGEQGMAGPRGSTGSNGQPGSDGQPGSNGSAGLPGQNGADGEQGAPGTVLLREQGVIGFGACDTDVTVSLASRIEISTATFFVNTVSFGDIDEACWGKTIDIYLFSGADGAYQLESSALDVAVPNSASFDVSYEVFDPLNIPSSSLTKLAIEITD
jgi:hypothetical protein